MKLCPESFMDRVTDFGFDVVMLCAGLCMIAILASIAVRIWKMNTNY